MALMLVELAMKYIPDTPTQSASLLSEGVKHVNIVIKKSILIVSFN